MGFPLKLFPYVQILKLRNPERNNTKNIQRFNKSILSVCVLEVSSRHHTELSTTHEHGNKLWYFWAVEDFFFFNQFNLKYISLNRTYFRSLLLLFWFNHTDEWNCWFKQGQTYFNMLMMRILYKQSLWHQRLQTVTVVLAACWIQKWPQVTKEIVCTPPLMVLKSILKWAKLDYYKKHKMVNLCNRPVSWSHFFINKYLNFMNEK